MGLLAQLLGLIPRCPFDGVRLVKQEDGSMKCPRCGYIKPAAASAEKSAES